MNTIQTKIISFANIRKKSINHCLVVLGADPRSVYYKYNLHRKSDLKGGKVSRRSIYDDFSRDELIDWVGHLYKESLKKYHPDKHPEDVRLYTEICQELSKAYQQAIKILKQGRK